MNDYRQWYGVDQNDTSILRLVYARFKDEYQVFLIELSKAYKVGEVADDINDIMLMVRDVMKRLLEIITVGKVGKKDAASLYKSIKDVEASKIKLMTRVAEDKEFKSKVEEIYETIGISPQDLSVTKEMMKAGVKQAKGKNVDNEFQQGSEQKHLRSTSKLKSVAEGMKIAGLGPFAPVLDIVGDLENWLRSKIIKPKKEKHGWSMPGSSMRGPGTRQQTTPTPQPVDRVSPGINYTENESASLFHFFNTKAYKAKWTKELLERIKGRGIDGKATESFKMLKSVATVTALGAGIAMILKILKLDEDARKFGKKATSEAVGQFKSEEAKDDYIKQVGLNKYAAMAHKTPEAVINERVATKQALQRKAISGVKEQQPLASKLLSKVPWWALPGPKLIDFAARKLSGYDKLKEQSAGVIQKEYERKFDYKPNKIDTEELAKITREFADFTKVLGKSVDKLSDNVGKTQTNVKPVLVGNPFDSADPWVTQLSAGKLTVGGR